MLRPRIRAVSGFVHLLSFSFARHNNQGQVSVKTRVFPRKADAVDRYLPAAPLGRERGWELLRTQRRGPALT